MSYIRKSKTKLLGARIKRLLEILSADSFNLYYMKVKDMKLIDFLSTIKTDKYNTHEIILIKFDLKEGPQEKYYISTGSEAKNQESL